MELIPKKRLQLFAGRSHPRLARDIAAHLGVELGEANLSQFANGEIHCRFGESIRGSDAFIIQTHCGPVNDSIMEQLIMIDAAKRASAKRITAVCPFYGYSRQDRKAAGREPITAKLLANMLMTAGVDRVVSVDLHSGQIQGFFDVPVDHLTAMPVLADYVTANLGDDVVIVSPDAGRVKTAERFAQHVHTEDLAMVHKRRIKGAANQVQALQVVGDVAGRVCVLVDDMIDTAGTICAAADLLIEPRGGRGARHRHPRGAVRPRPRPAEELPAHQGRHHRHPAPRRRPPHRQDRGPLRGRHHRRRPRRGVRGPIRLRDLRRREPDLATPGRRWADGHPPATA